MAELVNIISISDFSNPFIVVANDVGEAVNPYETRLNEIIAEYQKEILLQILGPQLYYELENDKGGDLPISGKWYDFINGKKYTKDSKTIDYKGIKKILTHLIYYYYNADVKLVPIENGEGALQYDNTKQVIPEAKMIKAWSIAVDLIGYDYLCNFSPYYHLNFYSIYWQPIEYYNYYQDIEKYKPTVYNFLNDEDETSYTFDNWHFTNFEKINKFDI